MIMLHPLPRVIRLFRMVALIPLLTLDPAAILARPHPDRTYYTDAKLEIMRSNLEKFDWARKQRDSLLAGADDWAKYDDATLRTLVVPPQVPRGYDLNSFGCPIHGEKVYEKGFYEWGLDFEKPFKVKCPYGGEEYPSNDFAAFLASGLKDRSLLTGNCPDDGWGWNKPGGKANYWFVAYYAHWSMRNFLLPAIRSLGTAAVICDDPARAARYAHKCALLLWQLAEYYPDYEYSKQSREGREHNPNYTGKLFNMIWEVATPDVSAPAYDAVRPFLADDIELQRLTGKNASEIDAEIRARLLLEAARCITDGTHRIFGNYGAHQVPLVKLAIVLNEKERHPTSAEMLEYVVGNPNPKVERDQGLRDALLNLVYRDGMPCESIGYNSGWVDSISEIAEALLGGGINFFSEPRLQKLLSWMFDVTIAGEFVPPLGDTGDMYARLDLLHPAIAYRSLLGIQEPDPRMVQALRRNPLGANELFKSPIEEKLARLPERKVAPSGIKSFLFPGYGLAYLQNGGEANRAASALFYGDYPSHGHFDQLNILLFSYGNPLLADIGYPEQTDSRNHKLYAFYTNTVAHNTVVVDAGRQSRGPGKLHAFQPSGFAQVVDASCEDAYKGKVSLYRRANMLVECSPEQSYLFDVFYVRGGKQHDCCALGPPSDFTCDPPLGPVQRKGTLAGEDVPYECFYDDARFAAQPLGSMSYVGYAGSGFQYLFNVRRASLRGQAICQWRLKQLPPDRGPYPYPWQGVALRAHLLGDNEELIAVDGRPQNRQNLPETIQYMLRRRNGENLSSKFVTVYEPFKGAPFIRRVWPVALDPDDGQAAAARIELVDGSFHYVFHSLASERTYTLDGKVSVSGQAACLAIDARGHPARTMLLNGKKLAIGEFSINGKGLRKTRITSIDYAKGIIELKDAVLTEHSLIGQTAIVIGPTFQDSLTIRKIIDSRHFSIGDEDLRVGGGPVNQVIPGTNRISTGVDSPRARTGMTVLNNRMQPQGRLAAGERLTLERTGLPPLKREDFPPGPDGAKPRFTIVMAGPGDELLIPSLVEISRKP